MKQISIILYSFLICFLFGCEKFDDNFGSTIEFGLIYVGEFVDVNSEGYTFRVSCPYNVVAGETEVKEVGFFTNSTQNDKVVGELIDGEIVATLSGDFGKSPYIQAYVETSEGVAMSNFINLTLNQQNFAPAILSHSVSFLPRSKYRIEVTCGLLYEPLGFGSITATLSGSGSLETKTEGNNIIIDIDAQKLSAGSYSYVDLYVGNGFGNDAYIRIPLFLNVKTATNTFADDGEKDDCIRLCGIDWAKGNLQYNSGEWRIAPTQDAVFGVNGSDANHIEYFCYGDIDAELKTTTHLFNIPPQVGILEYDIQGDRLYDVVAANLQGNWCLPTPENFADLLQYASCQYGYVDRNGVRTYGYMFYNSGDKILMSTQNVGFDAEHLDEIGLFLPTIGYYYITSKSIVLNTSLNLRYEDFYYMSSRVHKSWLNDKYGEMYLLFYYQWYSKLSSDYYLKSSISQVPVRPIKKTD